MLLSLNFYVVKVSMSCPVPIMLSDKVQDICPPQAMLHLTDSGDFMDISLNYFFLSLTSASSGRS